MNRPKGTIKLLDIKEGTTFLYRTPWGWEPCKFVMTAEPGWLRGRCLLENYSGHQAQAFVTFINPGMTSRIPVLVERYNDAYYTARDSHVKAISEEELKDWYNEQISERRDRIVKLNKELEWLTRAALDHAGVYA